MQDEQQFEQLILQYNQLKNSAEDIKILIQKEEFDNAITQIKNRESIFLNCKCIRKFLELTPEQEVILNKLLDELRTLEQDNIHLLQSGMSGVRRQLSAYQQNDKIRHAYDNNNYSGSIVNISDDSL